jgi:hypothetical protein
VDPAQVGLRFNLETLERFTLEAMEGKTGSKSSPQVLLIPVTPDAHRLSGKRPPLGWGFVVMPNAWCP